MEQTLLVLVILAYGVGALFHVLGLAFPHRAGLRRVGSSLLAAGFVAHTLAFGQSCKRNAGTEFFTLSGGLLFLGWLACGAFLAVGRLRRLPALGAFLAPVLVLMVLPGLTGLPGAGVASGLASNWLLPAHVTTSFLGLAVFALAFTVSAMYLLMEREVGGKHFGAFFVRLPSLADLDLLNHRLLRAGFLVFGLSLVTGALFAHRVWGAYWSWDPKQSVSLLGWLLYGGLLLGRRSGWHGRRAALTCMLGLVLLLGSFLGLSMLGLGRHGGSFQ